jgi:sterol desaturase/sphingolipid hydroxylase (fatty acid hydroxylase superfamily)
MHDQHSTLPILLVSLLVFGILETLFPFFTYKQRWTSRISTNLSLALLNSAVSKLPMLWILGWIWSPEQQKIWPGLFHYIPSPWVAGVLSFLMLDIYRYGWHCMMHFWPIGWRFHRLHHSDLAMNTSTAYRFHLLEVLASYVPMVISVWLFGIQPIYVFIYEVLFVIIQVFQHSNWALPRNVDRRLAYVIITPNLHRVHHSQIVKETDSNFGSLLTIWDRIFGTFRYHRDARKIDIGLVEYPRPLNVLDSLAIPFRSPK